MDIIQKNSKPFLKWAGGKSDLLSEIRKFYPEELGKKINKYCEPFVGGGAVLFDILNKYKLKEIYISDLNKELINLYKIIKSDIDNLIEILTRIQDEFLFLDDENRKIYYYDKREDFNQFILGKINDKIYGAALFVFLNRTCFNGLYRVNSKGLFNVPIGSYKNPLICDENNLKKVSKALKNVKIINASYEKSFDFIDENTFVYFDPPYRPLSKTSSFTSYSKTEFNDEEQINLSKFYKKVVNKGAFAVLSNSDPKNLDENDEFFDNLYKDFQIKRILAKRRINSIADKRNSINEILVNNFLWRRDMIEGGIGGGNTITGLVFEGKTDLATFIGMQEGYEVRKGKYKNSFNVFFNEKFVARIYKKYAFYKFLEELNINWKEIVSKKLLPDDSIFVIIKNTLYIIEVKFQKVAGSVDEKLQTCDFKKKQYQKLLSRANIDVKYMYLLSDWFRKPEYKDVLDYIISVNCEFYFEYIPLYKFGLPVPEIK